MWDVSAEVWRQVEAEKERDRQQVAMFAAGEASRKATRYEEEITPRPLTYSEFMAEQCQPRIFVDDDGHEYLDY